LSVTSARRVSEAHSRESSSNRARDGSEQSTMGESSSDSTTLATVGTAGVVEHQRTSVPAGVRIKWFQRKETLTIDIDVPDIEDPELTWTDDGLIVLKAKNPRHECTLQLLRRIHTAQSRWYHSGRTIKLELAKAEYGLGHWDRLVVGSKLPNVLIDWTSWMDEAEENEIRNNPYGHDVHHMASAMGQNWGSNIERTIKARKQAAAIDTSNPEDPEDDDLAALGF